MSSTQLSCLALLVVLAPVGSQHILSPDRGCVSSFRNATHDFDVCKTNLCFVILPERPHVIPKPKIESAPPRLFRCLNNTSSSGMFFDVLKMASKSVPEVREARCIYGGRNCSSDNLVRFIEDIVKLNNSHRFIAGGFLLFLPHRRTEYTIHSQPWFSERAVVLIGREGESRSLKSFWRQVSKPFSVAVWSLLPGFICVFCIALGIHVYRFSEAKSFSQLIRWFTWNRPAKRGMLETASWNSLKLVVTVFFTTFFLCYEIWLVILLDSDDIGEIEELKSLGLRNYAIVEGDASETIFKHAVGWADRNQQVPWVPVKTLDDAIALVRNKRVKYAFSFETSVAAVLCQDKLGDEISAIPTVKSSSGGWYYGISIPFLLRQKIDEALANLVLEDLPRKSLKFSEMYRLNCKKSRGELEYKVLLLTLAPVSLIIIMQIAYSVLLCCWPYIESSDILASAAPKI